MEPPWIQKYSACSDGCVGLPQNLLELSAIAITMASWITAASMLDLTPSRADIPSSGDVGASMSLNLQRGVQLNPSGKTSARTD